MIKIVTQNNNSVTNGLSNILKKVENTLKQKSGKTIGAAMLWNVKNHFKTIYPGSTHYSPDKVLNGKSKNNVGEIIVDVPGVTRAYHDITIKPKRAKALTIPIHRSAYGFKAKHFTDLFAIKRKDGKSFLARSLADGSLVFMYVLAKSAFQKQDKRLMPSDETLAENIANRLKPFIDNIIKKEVNTI